MDFDQLRDAYRRLNALERITRRPTTLERAHVILYPPGQTITLAPWPIREMVHVRNVGGLSDEVVSCSSVAGVQVADVSSASHLPARMRGTAALSVDVDPVALGADVGVIPLHVELRNAAGGSRQLTLSVPVQRPADTQLAVTHREVAFAVGVLNAHVFEVAAPGAGQAVLHIEQGPGGARRYQMARRTARVFEVAVVTEPGSQYAYRFFVDTGFRTDPRSPATVDVLGVSTPCSLLDTASLTKPLGVRNLSKQTLTVRPAPSSDVLKVSPAELRLGPAQEGHFSVTLVKTPPVGAHAADVVLGWKGPTTGALPLPASIVVTAPGPVPDVAATLDFGAVLTGAESSPAVPLRNVGSGVLTGRIESDAPDIEGASFSIRAGQSAEVPLKLRVPETASVGDHTGRVLVVSETPVADRQRIEVEVRYRVQSIVLEPAAIAFQVSAGTSETRNVQIKIPGPGKAEGLTVADDTLPSWLSLDSSKAGVLEVTIDGAKWPGTADEKMDIGLRLRHRRTGAAATLKIAGEFLVPRLEVEPRRVSFDRVASNAAPSIPIRLRNTGRGALMIQSIVLDHQWLTVVPETGADGEVQLMVGVNAQKMTPGRHYGRVELVTNDRSGNEKVTIDVRARVAG